VLTASTERDFETVFAAMTQRQLGGLIVGVDFTLFLDRREQLTKLAASHAVPAIYDRREFPAAGGLMSYGAREAESDRQWGLYAGRILKGEKPANLPVQQATNFELILNLKAAKALDLDVPLPLLGRADEVIEQRKAPAKLARSAGASPA
jgi:putative ABC transport system substrate-binding protein